VKPHGSKSQAPKNCTAAALSTIAVIRFANALKTSPRAAKRNEQLAELKQLRLPLCRVAYI